MTNTTILNAVALGTTAEQRTAQPTKTTLQAGTTQVILNARITLNGSSINPSDEIRVYYCIVPFSLTADTTLPAILAGQYDYLSIKMSQIGSSDRCFSTGKTVGQVLVNNGGYLYTWYDSPALLQFSSTIGSAPTITLTSVELP